jgi:outer membrane protein assembly factor BamB
MAQRLFEISPQAPTFLRSALLCFVVSFLMTGQNWAQWPEHRGNAQRTAFVEQELPASFWQLGWCFDELSPPQPAWPAPARSSLWQQLPQIEPRVTDDHADSPLLARDQQGTLHVLIASSANDRLVSIDPDSGVRRWEVVAGAPIRFAPATFSGVAYLGSDDGYLRAVRILDGSVLWEIPAGPGQPWIHGNGRLMSPHPIRTSPLFIEGRVYASSGLFPSQGVYALAVSALDGDLIWRRRLNRSPQGYSVAVDNQRYILPEGRAAPFMIDAATGSLLDTLPSPGGSFCMLTDQALFAGPGNLPRVESFPLGENQRPQKKNGQPVMLPIDGRATAAGMGLIWTANRSRLICYDARRVFEQIADNELWAQDCRLGQTMIASGSADSPQIFVAEGPTIEIYHGRSGQQLQTLRLPDENEQIFYLAVSQRHNGDHRSSSSNSRCSPVATLVASCRSGKIYGWRGYAESPDATTRSVAALGRSEVGSSNSEAGLSGLHSESLHSESLHSELLHSELLQRLLEEIPVNCGLILVSGIEGANLAVDIALNSAFSVALAVDNPSEVTRLQRHWQELGIYGHRGVVFGVGDGDTLPFEDDLFNAVIKMDGNNTSIEELIRVLAPGSGRLFAPSQPTSLKPIGVDLGAWRHQYASPANEAATQDSQLSQANCFRLRWFGGVGPRDIPDRHLRGPSPLAVGPSLVLHGDECLIGVDPANGVQRWHLNLPSGSMRLVMPYDCGYSALTAAGETLYTATSRSLFVIDALTGQLESEISSQPDALGNFPVVTISGNVGQPKEQNLTHTATEQIRGSINDHRSTPKDIMRWGYVAESQGWIFTSLMKSTAARLSISDPATARSHYSDQDYTSIRPLVCSRSFFCLNPSGKVAWSYRGGLLIHSSIALQVFPSPALSVKFSEPFDSGKDGQPPEGTLVFIESTSAESLASETDRIALPRLMEAAELVCLDLSCGEVLWRQPLHWSEAQNMIYTQLSGEFLVLVTSSSDDAHDRAHYSVRVHQRRDGNLIWEDAFPHIKKGLYHGEQVHHPVILQPVGRDPILVSEPYLFELSSGERIVPTDARSTWALRRPGHSCGSLTGCGENLFFRANNPTALNLFAKEGGAFTPLAPSRPGCWINMIPASGRLLIPEASASCVCSFPLQTSMAFVGARHLSHELEQMSQGPVLLEDLVPLTD